jgi:hypothetical protein
MTFPLQEISSTIQRSDFSNEKPNHSANYGQMFHLRSGQILTVCHGFVRAGVGVVLP